jgi:Ni/Co efflux regulator RcnB
MKKFVRIAVVIALISPVSSLAQEREIRKDRNGHGPEAVAAPRKTTNAHQAKQPEKEKAPRQTKETSHKFSTGQRFERSRAVNYRRVDHREHARLSPPPRGYTWVRAGNDALLVRLSNNIVTRIVTDIY